MEMRFKLVSVKFGESELHGLLNKVENPIGTAIHVHGTWGNFYANPFIVPTGELYSEFGLNFLTANFPGHDETAVNEKFEDFSKALDDWLKIYSPGGPLLLQGHSLGALKILFYMADPNAKNKDRVASIILLSPFDIVAFYSNGQLSRIHERLDRVKTLIEVEGPDVNVPKDMFDMWPISSQTFYNIAKPGSVSDQFPSRLELEGAFLYEIKIPVFIGIGSDDFAAYPSPREVIRMIKTQNNIYSTIINGAPHNFAGQVDSLANELRKWLKNAWKKR